MRAMFEITKNYRKGPITIKEIAERQDIPIPYLEQLLNRLRREGLIESVRGPGGGYILVRGPKEISIGEVLRALEGPIALSECLNPSLVRCDRINACVTRLLWKRLGEGINRFLEKTTLKDLCDEEFGFKVAPPSGGGGTRKHKQASLLRMKNRDLV